MKLIIWLYLWFFLDKFEWPGGNFYTPPEDESESRTLLYQSELETLLLNLRRQLPGNISIRYLPDGKGVIEEDGEVIATITAFPKADGRRSTTYIVVDLKPVHVGLRAWFQFAFIGFKVRFRKSTLYPVRV
jgi:hypothetical protein